jgi:RNA polymerase sigma-70 factor (ECF subfamily)
VFGQVHDRLTEVIRLAVGPQRDVNREAAYQDGTADPLVERLIESETGPATAFSRDERREIVRAALNRLDAIDREILALRYFDNLSFVQIGSILGLSQNAVTKRGLRALVKLRDLIPAAYRPPGASQP